MTTRSQSGEGVTELGHRLILSLFPGIGLLDMAFEEAVGNGVPLPMGRALAQAVIDAYTSPVVLQRDLVGQVTPARICACGCGRQVTGKARYYDFSCRKRAQRKRDATRSGHRV